MRHVWKARLEDSDLNVVGMLCGMQGGYTKYCCFLYRQDSRAHGLHYKKKQWPKRETNTVGENNIKYVPLVKKENIIRLALHIELGLFINIVKALNKESQALTYLKILFKSLSVAKIKEGVFDGSQTRKLVKDKKFHTFLSPGETAAWNSFKLIVSDFLGNNKNPDYKVDLLNNYANIVI